MSGTPVAPSLLAARLPQKMPHALTVGHSHGGTTDRVVSETHVEEIIIAVELTIAEIPRDVANPAGMLEDIGVERGWPATARR